MTENNQKNVDKLHEFKKRNSEHDENNINNENMHSPKGLLSIALRQSKQDVTIVNVFKDPKINNHLGR